MIIALSGCSKEVMLNQGMLTDLSEQQLISAQFSKKGKLLMMLGFDGQVTVFNADNFSVEFKVSKKDQLDGAKLAIMSTDGSTLLVANDNEVAIWSVVGKGLIGKTNFSGLQPFATISSIAISNDNDKLIIGMSDGTINMATISTRLNNRFKPHSRPVSHLLFVDNEHYWSASQDGSLSYRVFASPEPISEQEFSHRITTLTIDEQKQRLFVSDALKTQLIRSDLNSDEYIKLQYMARFMVFRQAHFINYANLLATSSSKNHLTIWDTITGEELGTWLSHVQTPTATILAMYSNDRGELLTVNSDAMVEKWDLTQLNTL
ncbi:hypothetical protein CWC21_21885 [Pseudoalteromonas phenolica]|nr:hypothetical protein CWC21_21885 [Pseudoalteromonas phenolica]